MALSRALENMMQMSIGCIQEIPWKFPETVMLILREFIFGYFIFIRISSSSFPEMQREKAGWASPKFRRRIWWLWERWAGLSSQIANLSSGGGLEYGLVHSGSSFFGVFHRISMGGLYMIWDWDAKLEKLPEYERVKFHTIFQELSYFPACSKEI